MIPASLFDTSFQGPGCPSTHGPSPPLHAAQPPLYAPEFKPKASPSLAGPPYAYLKLLSLVPSFEPPQVYALTETITTEATHQPGATLPAQLNTPSRLGVRDPANPTFSDVL